jgi:hypothetical protein
VFGNVFNNFFERSVIMKNRIFTQLTLIVAVLALTAVGEGKSLSLEDTKWKLVGFVDAETGELEEPDYSMCGAWRAHPYPTPPDLSTDNWFTLVFREFIMNSSDYRCRSGCLRYRGSFTSIDFYNLSYVLDYAQSIIDFGMDIMPFDEFEEAPDGERYYYALKGNHKFELTETSLKIYYSEGKEYLLFKPWEPAPTKIQDAARIVPQPNSDKDNNVTTAILPPEIILSPTAIAAGPNPVSKSAALVNFYRVGKQVKSASLKIYDASGKTINKIAIGDKSAAQSQSKRQVGSWALKDAKGRSVSEGTYLVKGTVKTVGGKSEKIALLISVR